MGGWCEVNRAREQNYTLAEKSTGQKPRLVQELFILEAKFYFIIIIGFFCNIVGRGGGKSVRIFKIKR